MGKEEEEREGREQVVVEVVALFRWLADGSSDFPTE